MRQLSRYINENQSTVEKFLQDIVDSAIEDPVIWDDSGKWNARENFEFWEDADGSYDEIINIIDKYASEKALAGWKTEDSFTETERYIPRKIFDIMRSGKHETPYKKYANKMDIWTTYDSGFDCTVLKFKAYKNKDGRDYIEYWYIITVEK